MFPLITTAPMMIIPDGKNPDGSDHLLGQTLGEKSLEQYKNFAFWGLFFLIMFGIVIVSQD